MRALRTIISIKNNTLIFNLTYTTHTKKLSPTHFMHNKKRWVYLLKITIYHT